MAPGSNDPLSDIENAKAQHDLGVTAFRIYTGARNEGASRREAFIVAVAWFVALLKSDDLVDKDEDESDESDEGDEGGL